MCTSRNAWPAYGPRDRRCVRESSWECLSGWRAHRGKLHPKTPIEYNQGGGENKDRSSALPPTFRFGHRPLLHGLGLRLRVYRTGSRFPDAEPGAPGLSRTTHYHVVFCYINFLDLYTTQIRSTRWPNAPTRSRSWSTAARNNSRF